MRFGKGVRQPGKASQSIPKQLRDQLTEVIASNLRSEDPRAMATKVGSNVDASHDLQIKHLTDEGIVGILILPKSGPAVSPQSGSVAKTAAEVAS